MIRGTRIPLLFLLLGSLLPGSSPRSAVATPLAFDLLRSAMAALPDTRDGKALYAQHCSRCHSADASGWQSATAPSLARQREYYLIEQLVQLVALDRNAPQMHAVLLAPDLHRPQALRDLAAYLSRLSPLRARSAASP